MRTLTVAKALTTCAKKLKSSEMSDETLSKLKPEISLLKKRFGLTAIQSCMLAVIMSSRYIGNDTEHIALHLGLDPLRVLDLHRDLERMEQLGIIRISPSMVNREWNEDYCPTLRMINAVRNNSSLEPIDYSRYTERKMWSEISKLFSIRKDDKLEYSEFTMGVMELMQGCQHIDICRKVSALNLTAEETILLMMALHENKENERKKIYSYQVEATFPEKIEQKLRLSLDGNGNLAVNHLMTKTDDDDFSYCQLTPEALRKLLGVEKEEEEAEVEMLEQHDSDDADDKQADVQLPEKQLFYDADEEKQIAKLRDMLEANNFKEITRRMEAEGMVPGLTCLLFGAPGTGKTETVKQLARMTGRKIIQVDMSSLRSKWCGETEHNVNQIFVDYSEEMENSDLEPILLFNEADAIISKRYTGCDDENVQYANSVQNILLENMERFKGIMVATSNLTENFDKAFERRFLFKICFSKPTAEVRARIWKYKIPELTDDEAKILAGKYKLSGAQIDNVTKKMLIDKILYGDAIDFDKICILCNEERLLDVKNTNLKQ